MLFNIHFQKWSCGLGCFFFAVSYRYVFHAPFIELSLALNIWLKPMRVSSFCWVVLPGKKGKGAHEPKAQTAEAYPGFIGMKHVGVLVLPPPGRDASQSPVPIYTPAWRETKWSKVPCLRKQHEGRGLNPGPPDQECVNRFGHTRGRKAMIWYS